MKRTRQTFDPTEDMLTTEQVAEQIGLHPDNVKKKCAAGQIRATKPGRVWRIPRSAVSDYLSKRAPAVFAA